MAAMEIPRTLAPFFQEYSLEKINPARDWELIIERTLAWGNSEEVHWLFANYGKERVADWVRRMGFRRLPRRQLPFWQIMLEIPKTEIVESPRGIWPY